MPVRVFLNFFKMVAKTQRAVLQRAKVKEIIEMKQNDKNSAMKNENISLQVRTHGLLTQEESYSD